MLLGPCYECSVSEYYDEKNMIKRRLFSNTIPWHSRRNHPYNRVNLMYQLKTMFYLQTLLGLLETSEGWNTHALIIGGRCTCQINTMSC